MSPMTKDRVTTAGLLILRLFALNLGAAFVALALTGAGQFSLDHRLARRRDIS